MVETTVMKMYWTSNNVKLCFKGEATDPKYYEAYVFLKKPFLMMRIAVIV